MKHKTLLGAILVLALLLAACAPVAATQAPIDTSVPTLEPTEPPAAADTAAVPVTGEVTVQVNETTDFGSILVNGEGMSLYVFMSDTQNSGTSACTDDCAVEWPPLTTDGDPVAGEGVDETLLGTITRDDGSVQVTYNGWPLYLFHEDMAPGDTNGQDVEDEFGHWFLVSPEGEAVQQ